jgi:hypothetical protein
MNTTCSFSTTAKTSWTGGAVDVCGAWRRSSQKSHGVLCVLEKKLLRLLFGEEHRSEILTIPAPRKGDQRRELWTQTRISELVTWLHELGVEQVASGTKGCVFEPMWNLLEVHFRWCWQKRTAHKSSSGTQNSREGLSLDDPIR